MYQLDLLIVGDRNLSEIHLNRKGILLVMLLGIPRVDWDFDLAAIQGVKSMRTLPFSSVTMFWLRLLLSQTLKQARMVLSLQSS